VSRARETYLVAPDAATDAATPRHDLRLLATACIKTLSNAPICDSVRRPANGHRNFQDRRIRPLCHPSKAMMMGVW
jgi:hypothetical protein